MTTNARRRRRQNAAAGLNLAVRNSPCHNPAVERVAEFSLTGPLTQKRRDRQRHDLRADLGRGRPAAIEYLHLLPIETIDGQGARRPVSSGFGLFGKAEAPPRSRPFTRDPGACS